MFCLKCCLIRWPECDVTLLRLFLLYIELSDSKTIRTNVQLSFSLFYSHLCLCVCSTSPPTPLSQFTALFYPMFVVFLDVFWKPVVLKLPHQCLLLRNKFACPPAFFCVTTLTLSFEYFQNLLFIISNQLLKQFFFFFKSQSTQVITLLLVWGPISSEGGPTLTLDGSGSEYKFSKIYGDESGPEHFHLRSAPAVDNAEAH